MPLLRKTLLAGIAVLCGLAAGLVVVEIGLRGLTPDWLDYRMRTVAVGDGKVHFGGDSVLDVEYEEGRFYRFAPGRSFRLNHVEFDTRVAIDDYGGRRVPARETWGDKSTVPLPVYGDSFAFGVGVEDAETFVNLLAERLDLPLVNLGVPGISLDRELDIVERRHQELGRPQRYLFVVYLGNDLTDLLRSRSPWPVQTAETRAGKAPAGAASVGLLARVNNLVNRSEFLRGLYVVQLAKAAGLRLLGWDRTPHVYPVFKVFAGDDRFLARLTDALRTQLSRLASFADRTGVEVLFVLVPSRFQIEDERRAWHARYYGFEDVEAGVLRPNAIFASVLGDVGVPSIDTTECLRERVGEGLYFEQDSHMTARGHAALADCLVPALRALGW